MHGMLALVLLLAAAPAALVEKAERQIEEADFAGAEATLQEALGAPDNDDASLIAIYGQLATVFLYQDRAEEAQGAFEKVLYLQPDWTPREDVSPKVRELFALVQARFRASAAAISVRHERVQGAVAGSALVVTADIAGLREPNRAVLQFRRKLAPAWSNAEFAREDGERFVALVPGPALEPSDADFEYYLEVQDASGTRLHGVGSAQEPIAFRVAKPPPPVVERPAWHKKWWVWALVGGAAVGIASAVILPEALDEPTGTMKITVTVE